MNTNTFVGKFLDGQFDDKAVDVQIRAGWYDWFCKNTSLANKTRFLGKKVVQLLPSKKIDGENTFVVFQNICPMIGPLFDEFAFCDTKTGEIIYTVTPRSGHSGFAEVFSPENDFQEPLVQGSWKDVKEFFGV